MPNKKTSTANTTIEDFLNGKPETTKALYHHFIKTFSSVGTISVHPAKTMLGIATSKKRIAWVTQLGKDFIHVVFPFPKAYEDNLCFQKIAKVPGDEQYNHHFRMKAKEDINAEVKEFMKLAFKTGS